MPNAKRPSGLSHGHCSVTGHDGACSQPYMLVYMRSVQSSSVAARNRVTMAVPRSPKWKRSFSRKKVMPMIA
eukprot:scaffold15302_cov58-Phaeocystis_antarctica.AAC.2